MERAARIIYALNQAGYRAYFVGGAVRDKLMGCTPKDVDIVTLATPGEIEQVAGENDWVVVDNGGRQHGVLIVNIDGAGYEVATARTEWYGEDSHRPAGVFYAGDIREDLARRDFTVNAMAQGIDGELIDPFGGAQDILHGVIRAVGDPAARFEEDALRSFRALRFAARFGYRVDENTQAAIPGMLHRVSGLSVERVRDELEKTLLAPHAAEGMALLLSTGLADTTCAYRESGSEYQVGVLPELVHLQGLKQNPRYHRFDAWGHTLAVIDGVPGDLALRWAALLHDVAKGLPGVRCINNRGELADHGHDTAGADMARDILSRLKVHPAITDRAVWLVNRHMNFPDASKKAVIKWLKKLAGDFKNSQQLADAVNQLLALRQADLLAGKKNPDMSGFNDMAGLAQDVLDNIPFYRKDLAIDGRQVADRLGSGPQVGRFLDSLLDRVQTGQLDNSAASLIAALDKKANRMGV